MFPIWMRLDSFDMFPFRNRKSRSSLWIKSSDQQKRLQYHQQLVTYDNWYLTVNDDTFLPVVYVKVSAKI